MHRPNRERLEREAREGSPDALASLFALESRMNGDTWMHAYVDLLWDHFHALPRSSEDPTAKASVEVVRHFEQKWTRCATPFAFILQTPTRPILHPCEADPFCPECMQEGFGSVAHYIAYESNKANPGVGWVSQAHCQRCMIGVQTGQLWASSQHGPYKVVFHGWPGHQRAPLLGLVRKPLRRDPFSLWCGGKRRRRRELQILTENLHPKHGWRLIEPTLSRVETTWGDWFGVSKDGQRTEKAS